MDWFLPKHSVPVPQGHGAGEEIGAVGKGSLQSLQSQLPGDAGDGSGMGMVVSRHKNTLFPG